MAILLSSILSSIISFALGWFLCKNMLQKKFNNSLTTQKIKQKNREKQLLNEQKTISELFFTANELKMEQQTDKLNFAFLENGRTVEIIGKELKSAQNLVTNAFSSLPNIHTCSQKTYQTIIPQQIQTRNQSIHIPN